MLDRLNPKKIIIVSSAPQIRYPDCYGIDMAKIDNFIAFKATLKLHEDQNTLEQTLDAIYSNCQGNRDLPSEEVKNCVKVLYAPFYDKQISDKIAKIIKGDSIMSEVEVIFQTIEGLHQSCPKNLGDWYFTGDYPTPGGNRVVNRAFMNFYEGKSVRSYQWEPKFLKVENKIYLFKYVDFLKSIYQKKMLFNGLLFSSLYL